MRDDDDVWLFVAVGATGLADGPSDGSGTYASSFES